MKKYSLEDITDVYAELVTKAISIVSDAPYFHFTPNEDYARITISGDTVSLYSPKEDTDYDVPYVSNERVNFPLVLLLMSDEEIATWKVVERGLYDKRQEEEKKNAAAKRDAVERAKYEELKEKFEGNKPAIRAAIASLAQS